MLYNGPYLRVLTPRTSNGTNPIIVNDMVQYKESHLPLTAKLLIEKMNKALPDHLKKKIEVVPGYQPPTEPVKPAELTDEELQAQIEQLLMKQAERQNKFATTNVAAAVLPKAQTTVKPTQPATPAAVGQK